MGGPVAVPSPVVLVQHPRADQPQVAPCHEPAGGVPDLVLGLDRDGAHPVQHPQQRLPGRLRPGVHPADGPGQRRGAPPPSGRRGEQGLPGGAAGLQGGVTEHHQVEQGEVPGAGEQGLLDGGHGQPAPGRPGHRPGVPDDLDLGPLGTGLRLGHADDHRQPVGQRRQPQVVQGGRREVGQHARGRQHLRPGHQVAPGRREVGLAAVEAEPDPVPPRPTYPPHHHVPLRSHPGRLPERGEFRKPDGGTCGRSLPGSVWLWPIPTPYGVPELSPGATTRLTCRDRPQPDRRVRRREGPPGGRAAGRRCPGRRGRCSWRRRPGCPRRRCR